MYSFNITGAKIMKHEEESKLESENNHVINGLYHDMCMCVCVCVSRGN